MANRYLVAGGNGQWNSTSNWSATSGGAAGASVPVAADTVIFDAASANASITVDVASICTSITASSYTGTLTVNSTLTCSTGFTFSTGMTCAGTGTITVTSSATLTSNGVVFPGTLIVTASSTITTTDSLTVGTLSFNSTSGSPVLTGGTINTSSLTSANLSSGLISGTTKIVLVGTGTVSFPVGWSGYIANSIDINSVSTTFVNNFRYTTGTLRYIAGTVDASASTLVLVGSCTVNTAGMNWGNVSVPSTVTITLASNLNISGNFSIPAAVTITFTGAFVVNTGTLLFSFSNSTMTLNGGTINTSSLLSSTISSGNITGTTKIILVGTGTVSFPTSWAGNFSNSIDINSVSTTFVNNFRYSAGTLRYIAGTVDTSASILVILSSCTTSTAGMNWSSIYVTATAGITLESNLNISGDLVITGAFTVTFGGAFVVNTGTLLFNLTSSTVTLNGGTINTNSLIGSTNINSGVITGTTKIVLVGTGTVNFPTNWTGNITNNIDINSVSTTFINDFRYLTGTLRYIAGTIDHSASTLVLRGNCTLNTAGMEWNNITTVAITLTLTSVFTCSGTFTITGSSLTIVGTGFWTRVGNLTFTAGAPSLTLLNNLTVTGTLTPGSSGTTINGNSLLIASLDARGTLSGTTTIVFNGTGTWSGTGIVTNNVTINTSGTLTISSNYANFRTGTLTYTAGTVDSSAGGLYCSAACTLNCSGMTWAKVLLTGTITLASNLNVTHTRIIGTTTFVNANRFTQTGILSIEGTCTFTLINNITVTNTFQSVNVGTNQVINGFQIICSGGITTTGTGTIAGTTTLLLNGTGTWTAPTSADTNAIRNNTVINTTGTITFAGYPQFNTGTLTYTAGTVVTAGSELRCWVATTLNTAGISWDNVSFTATITLSSILTVTGTAKIGGSATFVGANRFTQVGTLELVDSVTLTLINNIIVTNTFKSTNSAGYLQTMNSFQIICNGGIYTSGTGALTGTTSILLNGTGTWTSDNTDLLLLTSNAISVNVTINTAGTITFVGNANFETATLTYVAGNVVTTGSTLCCNSGTILNTFGIAWNNVVLGGTITLPSILDVAGTTIIPGAVSFNSANKFTQTGSLQLLSNSYITLPNNLTVLENLITVGSAGQHTINGFQLTVNGGLILSDTAGISGTTPILLNGTGTWSGAAPIKNNLTINTASTITVSGNVGYNTGTLTHVAGAVVTSGSKLSIAGNTTINTNGINWWDVDVNGSYTVSLTSRLRVNDTLVLNGSNITFAGTEGFTCSILNQNAAGTVTLGSGIDYVIESDFVSEISSNTSRSLFKSSVPGTKAVLTLENSASQSVGYVDATDIDSSLGQKIWGFKSILNNADNWQELTATSTGTGTGTTSAETAYTWVC